jgi:hypothetical protein
VAFNGCLEEDERTAVWEKRVIERSEVTMIIGISDIIKSFIYPFLGFGLTIFIGILYSEFAFSIDKIFPSGGGKYSHIGIDVNSKVGLSIGLALWLVLVFYFYKTISTFGWFVFGFIVAAVPSTLLDRAGLLIGTFENNTIQQQIIRLTRSAAFSLVRACEQARALPNKKAGQTIVWSAL